MSRHRNVRSMNYEDEYYDEDEMYGHSFDDSYCVSPGTAAQFTFNRDRSHDLSSYMDKTEGIPEEEEEGYGEDVEESPRDTQHRGSQDYTRPQLSDIDEAKLNSCLEEMRNVLGDSVPEQVMVDTAMRRNFSLESTLNELLNHQEKPKPQREPRQNRRNRSQGTTQLPQPSPVTGPTVILKQPKPKNVVTESNEILARVSITDSKPQSKSEEKTDSQSREKPDNRTLAKVNNQSASKADNQSSSNKKNKVKNQSASNDRTDSPVTSVTECDSKLPTVLNGTNGVGNKPNNGDSVKGDQDLQKNSLQEFSDIGGDKDLLSTPKKERFIPALPRSSSKSKVEKFDLKEEYRKRQGGKDMLNLVVIGHVDAGKSTMMGHLLYQLGNVNQRAMHKYEQESKKLGKSSFAYAWVLDETEEERVRGVTMDIAQTKFETPHKIITLLDAPGHKDFIPNMITGTAQADVGILVVNATKGEFETGFESGGQTREHALLARSLGVSQLIVAVNKMDTVSWQQARYDEVVMKLGQFLKQAGYKDADVSFIPVSGLGGENLARSVSEPQLLAWYKGSTLAEQIDKFRPVSRPVDKPLRVMISDVFKGMGSGFTVTGKVASGSIQLGDRVSVLPFGQYAMVKGIGINDEAVSFAFAGDHVHVIITGVDITHMGCGSVLCDPLTPVPCASRILARVVLFNLEIPITRGFMVIFHYQSVTEPAIVKKLVSQLNKSTGEVVKAKPKCLTKNSSAVVEIEFERPVCLELYKDNKELGRFMLRYSGHTIGAGMIEEVLKTKSGDGAEGQGAAAAAF